MDNSKLQYLSPSEREAWERGQLAMRTGSPAVLYPSDLPAALTALAETRAVLADREKTLLNAAMLIKRLATKGMWCERLVAQSIDWLWRNQFEGSIARLLHPAGAEDKHDG